MTGQLTFTIALAFWLSTQPVPVAVAAGSGTVDFAWRIATGFDCERAGGDAQQAMAVMLATSLLRLAYHRDARESAAWNDLHSLAESGRGQAIDLLMHTVYSPAVKLY